MKDNKWMRLLAYVTAVVFEQAALAVWALSGKMQQPCGWMVN
jgi:hypothetical protein